MACKRDNYTILNAACGHTDRDTGNAATTAWQRWAGAGLVLALALGGCNGPGSPPANASGASTSASAANPATATASAPASTAPAQSAKDFVQQFYDWYTPFTNNADSKEDVGAVLRDKKDAFDPALATAFAAYLAAQAQSDGEDVGLDYDPFVNAQDTCGKQQMFQTGAATQTGGTATVQVYAICDGKKEDKPRVLVSLSSRDGQWKFADFGTLDDPHQLTTALRESTASSTSDSATSGPSSASGASQGGQGSVSDQPLTKAQYDAIYNDCMKAAGEANNGVVDECTSKESDVAEKEIAQHYKAIRAAYAIDDPQKAAQFEKSQKAWIRSRDADCALEGGPGVETCVTDKNVARAIELRGMAP